MIQLLMPWWTFYFTAPVYHVPQFLKKSGSISLFNCQPVEKKNHEQLRMFHRVTKKGGRNSSYTTQVMEKDNCKIYARVNRLSRTKRSYQKKEPDLDDSPGSLNMYSHQNQEEG